MVVPCESLCVYMNMWIYMWKVEDYFMCRSSTGMIHHAFLRQGLLLAWDSLIGLGWLVSKSWQSALLYLPSTGIPSVCYLACFFVQVLGIKLGLVRLCDKHFVEWATSPTPQVRPFLTFCWISCVLWAVGLSIHFLIIQKWPIGLYKMPKYNQQGYDNVTMKSINVCDSLTI